MLVQSSTLRELFITLPGTNTLRCNVKERECLQALMLPGSPESGVFDESPGMPVDEVTKES